MAGMPDQTASRLGPAEASRLGVRAVPWRFPQWTRQGTLPCVLAAVLLALISVGHNVDTTPSAEDEVFLRRMMTDSGQGELIEEPAGDFDEEIDRILRIQDAVLQTAPVNDGLPLGASREPRDLYEAGQGLCYDRSRSIEKALTLTGLETRHVAVYGLAEGRTAMGALLTRDTPSHALTEVRTRRGWMLVDSNDRWIGLLADGRPVSADDLHDLPPGGAVWSPLASGEIAPIFRDGFVHVYGLYSRHGHFYPPMDGIPDVNLVELAQNLL